VAVDVVTPLCTPEQFLEGAFADLARDYTTTALTNILMEATRACESATDRRLAPFTMTETQRADAMDIEDAMDAYVPLDPTSQLGFSRAQSLGSTLLVRHFWVRETPPRYPEYWTGTINSIALLRSFSGTQSVDVSGVQYEQDTGHVRFALGTFVPAATTIVVNYSGGYSTAPADLVRACKYMAASTVLKELDPAQAIHGHDPDALRLDAMELLASYTRK
jgi:hypothetical protein